MSRGINKAIIVGNLGNDPDARISTTGSAITTISVGTNEQWKDKTTGKQESRTEWHRIVFFDRLAEIASEYLKKGSQVYVEGKIKTRKWQDQSGQDRYTTEIVANEMQMLGGKAEVQQTPKANPQTPKANPQTPGDNQQTADQFDDEIPF